VDGDAFCAFYERHAGHVYGFFKRELGDTETATDLTAETFAQALASVSRFRGSTGEELYFLLNSNGVRPKLDARGADISTSALGQVPIASDGGFSFDVPAVWQRYKAVGFFATTRSNPFVCSSPASCRGVVAVSYAPAPTSRAARGARLPQEQGLRAPRVGLEPTTLRLTGRAFEVV
jgi:Sigma-70 region 2